MDRETLFIEGNSKQHSLAHIHQVTIAGAALHIAAIVAASQYDLSFTGAHCHRLDRRVVKTRNDLVRCEQHRSRAWEYLRPAMRGIAPIARFCKRLRFSAVRGNPYHAAGRA